MNGRRLLDEKKLYRLCCVFRNLCHLENYIHENILLWWRHQLLTFIQFYTFQKWKVVFRLPHVCIIGTHHCGNTHNEDFKWRILLQDIFCCLGFGERVVTYFLHQIQSGYYDRNQSVSIEVILLEHFSATTQPLP